MGSANSSRIAAYSESEIGDMKPWTKGTAIPAGWVAASSVISRTLYPEAFAFFGTTWGNGDGSTTFSVPFAPANVTPWAAPRGVVKTGSKTTDTAAIGTGGSTITTSGNFTAFANRTYRITAKFRATTPSTALSVFSSIADGATTYDIGGTSLGSSEQQIVMLEYVGTLAAGTRNITLAANTSTGTFTASAGATYPATVVVEDLGGDITQTPYSDGVWIVKVQSTIPNFLGTLYGVYTSSTRPTGVVGRMIFESDTKRTLVHDGTGWIVEDEPWQTYTPTVTQGVAVSKTLAWARYRRRGRTCEVQVQMTTTSAGTSANVIFVSLPVAPDFTGSSQVFPVGVGHLQDTGTHQFMMTACLHTSQVIFVRNDITPANYVGADPSFALANTDLLSFNAAYEVDSPYV
jgi:hypothetical protein